MTCLGKDVEDFLLLLPLPPAVIPACSTPTLQINLGERMYVQALQLSSWAFMSSAYMAMVSKQLGAFMFGGIARFSLTSMAQKITSHLSPTSWPCACPTWLPPSTVRAATSPTTPAPDTLKTSSMPGSECVVRGTQAPLLPRPSPS